MSQSLLTLERPIVFIDFETTGINTDTARAVEIAFVKIFPDGSIKEKSTRINPTIPIPQGASEIHKIYDADVADKPTFASFAIPLAKEFAGCDFGGQNVTYDLAILANEFFLAGIDFDLSEVNIFDTYQLEAKLFPRDLATLFKKYTNAELVGAHGALTDTKASLSVSEHQMKVIGQQMTVKQVDEFTQGENKRFDLAGRFYKDAEGNVCFGFGKYKGSNVMDTVTDNSYWDWVYSDKCDAVPKLSKRMVRKFILETSLSQGLSYDEILNAKTQ